MTRTINMSAEEITAIDTLPRFGNPIQDAMLALRKRSGIRYGSQVRQGRYDLVTVAYALNKKGRPTGVGDITIVAAGLTAENLVALLSRKEI